MANMFHQTCLQTVFAAEFCFSRMKCFIVTAASAITFFLSHNCCIAQTPKVSDSILYHFRNIKSVADSNHYKAAISLIQENREEVLFDHKEINNELTRLQTVLDEKSSYLLILVFLSSQGRINTPSAHQARIKWGKEFIARHEKSDSKYIYDLLLRILWGLRIPYRNSADIYDGIEYFNVLNKKYRDENDSIAVSITYQVIAGFYFRLGLTEESIYNCLKSEDYLRKEDIPLDFVMDWGISIPGRPANISTVFFPYLNSGKAGKVSRNWILGNYLVDANRASEAEFYLDKKLKTTQSQLIQSEKMASLGELTAGIAHEIQNPLNFVNNFSDVNRELLSEMNTEIEKANYDEVKAIAKDIRDNEEKINHHGKRADAIVKGMLQHSRSSSGQKEPTDINALADEYLRLSYHGLRAKDKSFNAILKTDFDESIGKINIVPQEIGRVVLNLINNAFYAVDEKRKQNVNGYEPTVLVRTRKNAGKIEISVKDNGNGIPSKLLDKIFQPFFTTKPTGQGTGLGLSLSYDIVKAHGGELKVETSEGEGTEFLIQLPAK
jgi:signal transduction histidine kinase